MDVRVVRWERSEIDEPAVTSTGREPRLYLVDGDDPPPLLMDPLADWIRLPASEEDIEARTETLRRRATTGGPVTVADGVVTAGTESVALSPVEERLLAALMARAGTVVAREVLLRDVWPTGRRDRNRLDAAMRRLRRRVGETGIEITTVRGRGYLLRGVDEPSDSRQTADPDS